MTSRRRWIATLWRASALCAPDIRLMWRSAALGAAAVMLAAGNPTHAATLRVFNELASPDIRLSDLFARLETTPDRWLGPAPAPGGRVIVEAPQLAAIARDYGVAWRPESGAERAVLERAGTPLPMKIVLTALHDALLAAGAPPDADIELPGFTPPVLPAGSIAHTAVAQMSFDSGNGRFTSLLAVTAPDIAPINTRLDGQVVAMADTVVLTRHLRPGTVLSNEDIRAARLHATLLHGNIALTVADAVGQALRHDIPPGQPLSEADVMRPRLVMRNDLVRMNLEANGIVLAAQGLAMEEGGMGDRIRVQNPASHAVVIAEIIGSGAVRVTPGQSPIVVASQ
jgi:flagella basal body P-ring formation protein FlgA